MVIRIVYTQITNQNKVISFKKLEFQIWDIYSDYFFFGHALWSLDKLTFLPRAWNNPTAIKHKRRECCLLWVSPGRQRKRHIKRKIEKSDELRCCLVISFLYWLLKELRVVLALTWTLLLISWNSIKYVQAWIKKPNRLKINLPEDCLKRSDSDWKIFFVCHFFIKLFASHLSLASI